MLKKPIFTSDPGSYRPRWWLTRYNLVQRHIRCSNVKLDARLETMIRWSPRRSSTILNKYLINHNSEHLQQNMTASKRVRTTTHPLSRNRGSEDARALRTTSRNTFFFFFISITYRFGKISDYKDVNINVFHLLISIRAESDLIIMWLHTEPRTDAKFKKFPTSLYRRPPFKHKPHAMSSTDPNQSLYIKGLPEKIRVEGNHQSVKARGDLNHVSNLRIKKLTLPIYRNQSISIYTVSHVWRHIRYRHNEEGQDARTSLCCFWWHSVRYSSLKEFEWISILRKEPCKLSCCHIVCLPAYE